MGTFAWYNYRTKSYEYLDNPPLDYSDYVPQGAGSNLYKLLVENKGMKPIEACAHVLEISAGVKKYESSES